MDPSQMLTWPELQSDISLWATRNFGENPAWQPMLGLIEEIAEYLDAENEKSWSRMQDALGDQTIYVLSLCDRVGLDFGKQIAGDPANAPSWFQERELLGALGLASRAVLKHAQGIRGMDHDARREHLRVCLGLWYRWATWQILMHFPQATLPIIVGIVWAEVRKRDWVRNPTNAHEVVQCAAYRALKDGTAGVAFCVHVQGHNGPHLYGDEVDRETEVQPASSKQFCNCSYRAGTLMENAVLGHDVSCPLKGL